MRWTPLLTGLVFVVARTFAQAAQRLPGTELLELPADPSAAMVAGIDRFLMLQLERATAGRATRWNKDLSSPLAYSQSIAPHREILQRVIGAIDARMKVEGLDYVSSTADPALVAETELIRVWSVRWPVFEGVFGEGLLLEPRTELKARVVALPDADQTPEMIAGLASGVGAESQFARRLAENGCQVLVPMLVDRNDAGSGNQRLNRFTNQPHREWIYRQAFELGRHIVGYEVQKIRSALDWFALQNTAEKTLSIGLVGFAEGGLIALHTAALDARVAATVVSGYFESRQRVWAEPIYRNLFGELKDFGDAELAAMCAPRRVFVEHSESPQIKGPPPPRQGRSGAAPGVWATPEFASVSDEVRRAEGLLGASWARDFIQLINGSEGSTVAVGSDKTLLSFLRTLGVTRSSLLPPGKSPSDRRTHFSAEHRQRMQVEELVQHTQRILRQSESVRNAFLLRRPKPATLENWAVDSQAFRTNLWDEVIGRLPVASSPSHPRSRLSYENPKWDGYDVTLDVWPDVFAWGVLLLPKDLKPGERRPVVVCQHGLEGLPADTINQDPKGNGHQYYKGFAAELAERGFVVFAPHNPYRGGDRFRLLQRKANPLGCSLFSVILAQQDRILDWLTEQPFVDPKRIGFYGLSYGGKTAMRVPALLDRYCLSICSADFNEWITKNATVDSSYSYLFGGEYEMPEFNLGNTFNYAEMAALIAPRPFMVERGHDDGVAPDEWVAHEFARVQRFYTKLGIGSKAAIEFFDGPHTINGQGTFRFLHTHLSWPEPSR